MKLSDFHLPSILLPNNPENNMNDTPKNELSNLNENLYEINDLLKDMKENEHRTTNFATILYLEENNYEKLSMDTIKIKIKKDFNLNKNMFVNSKNNTPFETERNLIQSMSISIARNKAFITEIIDKKKYVSLNKPKTIEYLKRMYGKYTSNNNGDVTSLASVDSKRTKIIFYDNKSEKRRKPKNFIGNKTLRTFNVFNYEEIVSDNEEERIYKNYKYLRDNLQEINPKNIKVRKEKEKEKEKEKKPKKEKINNNTNKKDEIKLFSDDNENNKVSTMSIKEIDKTLDNLNETEKIISSYKTKLNEIRSYIDSKEKQYKDFNNRKINVNSIKNELNVLYEIMSIKLGTIQSTKKHKYYGAIFPKSKQIVINYKYLFENKIKNIEKNISEMNLIESDITNKNKKISEEMKDINQTDNDSIYLVKSVLKKDFNNLMKTIKNEKKNIGSLYENESDKDKDIEFIHEIKIKFNDITQEISQEKEDFGS